MARTVLHRCWELPFDRGAGRLVASAGDIVLFSESDGRVRAIASESNATVWVADLGGHLEALIGLDSSIFALSQTTDSVQNRRHRLRSLVSTTGLTQFDVSVTAARPKYIVASGAQLIITGDSGDLEAFNAEDGTTLWRTNSGGNITAAPIVGGDWLVVPTAKEVIGHRLSNGTIDFRFPLKQTVRRLGIRENKMLLVGDERGSVTNYRQGDSSSIWWSFKSGGGIGSLEETVDGILVGSYDNFLYLVSKYAGDVIWKRRLEGRVVFNPLVAEGEIFVVVSGDDELLVLDQKNGKVLERIVFGDGRVPTGDPIESGRKVVVPVEGGLIAFSKDTCK